MSGFTHEKYLFAMKMSTHIVEELAVPHQENIDLLRTRTQNISGPHRGILRNIANRPDLYERVARVIISPHESTSSPSSIPVAQSVIHARNIVLYHRAIHIALQDIPARDISERISRLGNGFPSVVVNFDRAEVMEDEACAEEEREDKARAAAETGGDPLGEEISTPVSSEEISTPVSCEEISTPVSSEEKEQPAWLPQ